MSNNTSSFGATNARNAFLANNFHGPANITINEPQEHSRPHSSGPWHSIPFPPNEDLVHRSDITRDLDQLLPSTTSDYQSAALWGLGGSGKTQIALAYAYGRCRDPTCSVFWVHADTETSFTKDYQSIARKLGVKASLEGEDLLTAVRNRIEDIPNWVLVLDNADDLTLFGVARQRSSSSGSGLNLNDFVPLGQTGTVLWTSRDRQIGRLVATRRTIHIVQMTSTEAETLLDTIKNEKTNEDEHDAVRELLAELDCLPLAVSQAAAYMRRTSTSVGDYLSEIRRSKGGILRRPEHDQHRRGDISNSVLETWDISVQHLRKENELIYDVLHSLAYVDNQDIPFELICEATQLAKQSDVRPNQSSGNRRKGDRNEESKNNNYYDTKEVITRLSEFSFLSIRTSEQKSRKKVYDIHKLVQEAARYRLRKCEDETKGQAYFAKAAFQITNRLFPHIRSSGDHYLSLDTHWDVWDRCEQYLAHAQQAGTWAELHKGELEVAQLLIHIFNYLSDRGRVKEMGLVIRKALDFRQKLFGERHLDTIDTISRLGATYNQQGKYEEAEKLHRQALELSKEVLGRRHPGTLTSMNNLGNALFNLRKYEQAEKLHRQTLELSKEVLGRRHPYTLASMNNLGIALGYQGKYEQAEKLHQTLELRKEVLGRRHPDTLTSMNNLGIALGYQGKYEEAEKLHRQGLELSKEVSGRRHPDTLASMNNLGIALGGQGKYEEAEKLHRQTLELRKEVLGRRHPDTLGSINNLGMALGGQEKYEEAEKLHRQTLELRKEVLGRRHPDTLASMNNLGMALGYQGKYEEAEKLHQTLELRKEVLGRRHPSTLGSMYNLAHVLRKQGQHEEAEEISKGLHERNDDEV
ncbi:hypothetical protein F4803DRAFT_558633 [Xylaria telfairii]|nr:hypothetical protein F4803DRAFT_558633 [Xylaria telfairii]